MEDATTIVELKIQPAEFLEIVQSWVTETKFSVHEANEARTVYSKNIRLITAWLVIENQYESVIINAWLAPKGMTPESKGSFWKGYKAPVPRGFAIGPAAIYKKQFNKLMQLLENKSKDISYKNTSTANQQNLKKEDLAKAFAFLGIIIFVSGAINCLSAVSLYMNSSPYSELTSTIFTEGLFDVFFGVITYICSRLLKSGKILALWLYCIAVFVNAGFDVILGHGLPYFSIIFSGLIIVQLWELKKRGELV
ncbi:MAG: hypothetical protein JNM55_11300 [Anaerolineales bacterium]|nr:hypothetical protein [Anaerolineales bacterium]